MDPVASQSYLTSREIVWVGSLAISGHYHLPYVESKVKINHKSENRHKKPCKDQNTVSTVLSIKMN